MISDRKMSKLKSGLQLRLSTIQFAALLFAIIHAMTLTQPSDAGENLSGTSFTMFLFTFSLLWTMVYIIGGPRLVNENKPIEESE
jgi:hypothetical protein